MPQNVASQKCFGHESLPTITTVITGGSMSSGFMVFQPRQTLVRFSTCSTYKQFFSFKYIKQIMTLSCS